MKEGQIFEADMVTKKKREGGNDINQDYLRKSDTKTP